MAYRVQSQNCTTQWVAYRKHSCFLYSLGGLSSHIQDSTQSGLTSCRVLEWLITWRSNWTSLVGGKQKGIVGGEVCHDDGMVSITLWFGDGMLSIAFWCGDGMVSTTLSHCVMVTGWWAPHFVAKGDGEHHCHGGRLVSTTLSCEDAMVNTTLVV